MHTAHRTALALGLLGLVVLGACSNPQGFVEPKKHTDPIVALRNNILPGQSQLVYRVTVQPEPEMTHPMFIGRWNFADVEKPIDVYVCTGDHYVETVPPAAQDSVIFWSSLQNAVVGQQRETTMELHPKPGNWVIVFYNAAAATSVGRATFSADVSLQYFK